MIKTPVTIGSVGTSNYHTSSSYPLLLCDYKPLNIQQCHEAAKRINMHDELVLMLKDIALVDGGSECIKSKIARARKLLEKCK